MDVSKDKLKKIIEEIAGNNDCGMTAYLDRKSLELILIPSELGYYLDDFGELYKEDLGKIDKNPDLYLKVEPPFSSESFVIMRDFIDHIDDDELKYELSAALNRRKPFAKFKHIIDNSYVRENWFAFKKQELIKRVRTEIQGEFPGLG